MLKRNMPICMSFLLLVVLIDDNGAARVGRVVVVLFENAFCKEWRLDRCNDGKKVVF